VLINVGHRVEGISGYTPAQIAGAYGVTQAGAGAIAVVDAYNYPTALSDFNVFANQFGLPTESSGVATANNTTFQVVYAAGVKPSDDSGWSQESAVDIEWTHSMAPNAKIYLVEAASSLISDMMVAVRAAKALPGVREVSTSFGIGETACSFVDYDPILIQNGVTFFASAGDSPGDRDYPAESMNVVAVGGTSLQAALDGTYVSESVWDSTGCGPSNFEPRPVFQDVFYSKIGLYRGACDISSVADPNTGVAIYDSTPYQGTSGWLEVGGTSVSCPVVAGIVNSAGVVFDSSQTLNSLLYGAAGTSVFHPVTKGSSGGFKAGTPWSFPTGLGSPSGLASLLVGG
jgi:subtilase family serine protease